MSFQQAIPVRDPPTVAVIGGGFSGLLTAIHLLRDDPRVRVRLIERERRVGPGRAYATPNPDHRLNVRAANMSAFVDDPDHFRRWLEAPEGDLFVTRGAYGDYLRELLDAELSRPEEAGRLRLDHGTAVAAHLDASGWTVQLDGGPSLSADAVVLAIGFLAPSLPVSVSPQAREHSGLIVDPWAMDLPAVPKGELLLLGTGLTMVDVALALEAPDRRLTAMSRRGLLPQGHGAAVPAPAPGLMTRPSSALKRLRAYAGKVGWRTAVDSVRWVTPEIWRAWTVRERRQFLRHLRPWWDSHRHRMAPEVASRMAAMLGAGSLDAQAAKVKTIERSGNELLVTFRGRGERLSQTRRFAAVINCAAPRSDIDKTADALVADLRVRGLIRGDPLGLGLDLGPGWTAIGADGRATPGLYAIGPLTRSAVWEAVAVPDLRRHAQQVSGSALGYLAVDRSQTPVSAVRGG